MIANFMTNRKQQIAAQTPQLNHIANKEKHKICSSSLYNPDLSQPQQLIQVHQWSCKNRILLTKVTRGILFLIGEKIQFYTVTSLAFRLFAYPCNSIFITCTRLLIVLYNSMVDKQIMIENQMASVTYLEPEQQLISYDNPCSKASLQSQLHQETKMAKGLHQSLDLP